MKTRLPASLASMGIALSALTLLAGAAQPDAARSGDVTQIEAEPVHPDAPLEVGDHAPNFKLRNADDEWVDLASTLERGPVVLSFYRGVWCPYCNKELKGLERVLPRMDELGATVLALSPESRDHVQENVEKNKLTFDRLTDTDNAVAKLFGLQFVLDDKTVDKYEGYGIDVATHNGTGKHELPIPATYIIDTDGVIAFAFVDEDYTKRAKTRDIVRALEKLVEDKKSDD